MILKNDTKQFPSDTEYLYKVYGNCNLLVYSREPVGFNFMKITEKAYKQFEKIWILRNPGKQVNRVLLHQAAERLLDAVNHIYKSTDQFENREQ